MKDKTDISRRRPYNLHTVKIVSSSKPQSQSYHRHGHSHSRVIVTVTVTVVSSSRSQSQSCHRHGHSHSRVIVMVAVMRRDMRDFVYIYICELIYTYSMHARGEVTELYLMWDSCMYTHAYIHIYLLRPSQGRGDRVVTSALQRGI